MSVFAGLLLLAAAPQDGTAVSAPVASAEAQSVKDEAAKAQCRGKDGYAQDFGGRRTFIWRPAWLKSIKARPELHKKIISSANKALGNKPYSVTEKTNTVPGATPNDYISIGPYWWPDPKKKSGLPYIQRDGERNPESRSDAFDKQRMVNMGRDVKALSLAYYITEDERYAAHAANMLRSWFINPETRMNPNMNFAQGIPGKVYGRGIGIIESAQLSDVVESIGLLSPSPVMSAQEHKVIRIWYRDFAVWLATSDNGIDELNKNNNHGVFYDFYLGHFALFTGLESVTKKLAEVFPKARLASQMDRNGRFIAELKRTRSWHYSHYILEGAGKLATIAECVDTNLWAEALPDGRSLETAQQFVGKYWTSDEVWPFKDRDLPKKPDRVGDFKTVLKVQKLFARGTDDSIGDKETLAAILP
jgi:hypothetical protein